MFISLLVMIEKNGKEREKKKRSKKELKIENNNIIVINRLD